MDKSALIFSGENNLNHLRNIAWTIVFLQFLASVIYLFCSLFAANSGFYAELCGILSISISLTPVIYCIINRKIYLVFSCITAFNIAPIWFLYLEAILPGYDAHKYSSPEYKMQAYFWIAIFQMFVNLFYVVFWNWVTPFSIKSFSFFRSLNLAPKFFSRLTFFSFFIPFIVFYFYYGSFDLLWTAMTAGRSGGGSSGGLLIQESVGGIGSLILPLNWLLQLTPLFGTMAFIYLRKQNVVLSFLCLALGLVVIFIFFLSGSRGITMFVAAPVLFFLFYYNWNKGLSFWLIAVTILFLLIGIMEIQERFRGNLLDVIANPAKAAKSESMHSVTTFDPTQSHRDNNMYLLCLMVKSIPSKYSYTGFYEFYAVLVNPIPRAIWPNKPIMNGAKDLSNQASYINDGPVPIGTTSLSFSIAGEAYGTQGIWSILLFSCIYALFLTMLDGIVYYTIEGNALTVGMLGLSVFLAFWGYRSFFALISFLYPLLLLIFVIKILLLLKIIGRK